jgi:hypothetical protein
MNRPATRLGTLALAGALIAPALSGCERKPPDSPANASSSAPSTVPPAEWSKVQPASPGEAIMAEKTIARHCDAWEKGAKPRIQLHHDGLATLSDDAGHSMSVTAQDFKAIVQQVRGSKQPTSAAASRSAMYSNGGPSPQDTFGVLPRYTYTIEVIDDATVVYRTDRKVDDGT